MPDGFEHVKEISEEELATWKYDDEAFNAYYDAASIGTPVYETDAAKTVKAARELLAKKAV